MTTDLRQRIYTVIFGIDTPAGRRFDVALIIAIVTSVVAVLLDSISPLSERFGGYFYGIEWFFTLLFTVEYAARLYCHPQPLRYAVSFYGVVDLLSILPTYIGLWYPEAKHLLVVRMLRVFRVFRILKMFRYLREANVLFRSLAMARRKIFVFLFSVMILMVVFGSVMFVIEGPDNGFTSIPRSIYWAIVTMTTVGYGDITPHTVLGQAIAGMAMITGYSIIAVPTGILSAELITEMNRERLSIYCQQCGRGEHDSDAVYCKHCGTHLNIPAPESKP